MSWIAVSLPEAALNAIAAYKANPTPSKPPQRVTLKCENCGANLPENEKCAYCGGISRMEPSSRLGTSTMSL